MTFVLIHHTCTHHMIQTNNDSFKNVPHLNLQNSMLQTLCFLLPITQ
jgi:hypothetical protein